MDKDNKQNSDNNKKPESNTQNKKQPDNKSGSIQENPEDQNTG